MHVIYGEKIEACPSTSYLLVHLLHTCTVHSKHGSPLCKYTITYLLVSHLYFYFLFFPTMVIKASMCHTWSLDDNETYTSYS